MLTNSVVVQLFGKEGLTTTNMKNTIFWLDMFSEQVFECLVIAIPLKVLGVSALLLYLLEEFLPVRLSHEVTTLRR